MSPQVERGKIAVKKTGEHEYGAQSQSKDTRQYRIAYVLGWWCCSCKDFAHTRRACKRIAAMKNAFDPSPPPKPAAAAACVAGTLRAHCAGPRAADSASDGRGDGGRRPEAAGKTAAQRIRTGHAGGWHGRRQKRR